MSNNCKDRLTHFKEPYKKYCMPLNKFCTLYKHTNSYIDLRTVMRRLNTLMWNDFESIIIPTNLGDARANKIRRAITCIEKYNHSYQEVDKRFDFAVGTAQKIDEMDDYMKSIFLNMDHYFLLNPDKIDLNKVFVPLTQEEHEEMVELMKKQDQKAKNKKKAKAKDHTELEDESDFDAEEEDPNKAVE